MEEFVTKQDTNYKLIGNTIQAQLGFIPNPKSSRAPLMARSHTYPMSACLGSSSLARLPDHGAHFIVGHSANQSSSPLHGREPAPLGPVHGLGFNLIPTQIKSRILTNSQNLNNPHTSLNYSLKKTDRYMKTNQF